MKVLVTGFEPFGGDEINPSWEAVKGLPERIGTADVIKLRLPVSFRRCACPAIEAIGTHRPDVVVCVGAAGKRLEVTPERVAINVMNARQPDNDGFRPVDLPIHDDGPAAYVSTLPVKEMVACMEGAGIPSKLSNTAGMYVCNTLMYRLLDYLSRNNSGTRAGFIHVPKTLAPEELTRGLVAAIETIITKGTED